MISWNVTASFLKHFNLANVRIPLHQFLKDFKIVEAKIENDSLVLHFAEKNHTLHQNITQHLVPNIDKVSSKIKSSHIEIE